MTALRYAAVAVALSVGPAFADPAEIVAAEAEPLADGWRVSVTLRHADTGWDDYADGWRVVTADGSVVAERPLAHPHVDEQPFTRSVQVAALPEEELLVEARTSVEGWGEARRPLERR